MKTTKELLIILRDKLKATTVEDLSLKGLCYLNDLLKWDHKITNYEHKIINNFIVRNKPNYNHRPQWGWKPGLKTPRLKWLNEKIEKLC